MKLLNLFFFFLVVLTTGCHKTESFYDQVDRLPRINNLSSTAYAVGDTLTLTGKFGAGKTTLKVSIGGVNAPVISITTKDSTYTEKEVLYNYTFDKVKVLITEAMIGQQQLIVATVNGVANTLASILVSKDRLVPVRTDTLNYLDPKQATIALRMPLGTRVISNYTPGGAIIFMNGDSLVTWQEGVIRRGKVIWKDSYGDFSVLNTTNINYGYAIDPSGNNLYISCITKDALLPGPTYSATRLMKVSLRDYGITTLNRTVLPTNTNFIDDIYVNLDTVKREGNIGQVFLPVMKNIYVSSKGELFFSNPILNWSTTGANPATSVQTNLTVARLDVSGTFQYLTKISTAANKIFAIRFRKKGVINAAYDFIPNITSILNYNKLLGIDAENNLLYGYAGTSSASNYTISTFYCYNLAQQRQLGEFTYKLANSFSPTITDGPFNVVEGSYKELTTPTGSRVFQWPAPGQPTVIFALQQQYQHFVGQNGPDELKSVKMINFSNRTVSTYAPFIQGATPASKYWLGIGGDVIGYTASKQPVMVCTKEIDATLNEVLLLAPVK